MKKLVTLSSLIPKDKFTLWCDGRKYQRFGRLNGRIKVKPVGHFCSPLVSKDLTGMTFALNCKVIRI